MERPAKETFTFYVTLINGQTIQWKNLSQRDASQMHKITGKTIDSDAVARFGWEPSDK